MQNTDQTAYLAALEWQIDHGVDVCVENQAVIDRSQKKPTQQTSQEEVPQAQKVATPTQDNSLQAVSITGSSQLKKEAIELASSINSLEELSRVIQDFNGLDVKKTATNFVFSDGNPKAKIMLVGEAPGADEDRLGKPFVGVSGQLLDKILACIGLDRHAEVAEDSIYISNILNWRPPGNRTPTPQEMEIAKPFIEKHIALINPDYLIFCGGVAAQTLLHTKDSISRLRGKKHEFSPQTLDLEKPIIAIATYHPAYLLRTPSQKSKVWQDMLFLKKMMLER